MTGVLLDAVIVGAGPAGIALAARLRERGVAATVLEAGPAVGTSWAGRHPQLSLNTHRVHSALPGARIPRSAGAFPSATAYLAHLRSYAADHEIEPHFETKVLRVDPDVTGWTVETSRGPYRARQVVLATGFDHTPRVPDWPGAGEFEGRLLHSADLGAAEAYRGKSVLVVGAGNSGGDVLNTLVRSGVDALAVSVRDAPVILAKRVLGFPMALTAPGLEGAPAWLADRVLALAERSSFGDVRKLGLRRGTVRGVSRLARDHVAPAIDDGFMRAIRKGEIAVYPEIERFEGAHVRFVDGRRMAADIVIAATGYTSGLSPIVGHLDVLDARGRPRIMGAAEAAPGLWFAMMTPPIGGTLRALGRLAEPLAAAIHGRHASNRERLPRGAGAVAVPVPS